MCHFRETIHQLGQRETQTKSTHGGKWGTGGHNRESGKTIGLVTHEEEQVT